MTLCRHDQPLSLTISNHILSSLHHDICPSDVIQHGSGELDAGRTPGLWPRRPAGPAQRDWAQRALHVTGEGMVPRVGAGMVNDDG